MTDCTICAEKYNKTNHKVIGCEYCDFNACQTCVKTYLLDKPEPKCMNTACDRQWTRKFLSQNLTPTFINKEFRPHLSAVQFELEKSRLPSTQITLELENQVKRMRDEEKELKSRINDMQGRLSDISYEKEHLKSRLIRRYRGEEDLGDVNANANANSNANENEKERPRFVRACPANDCRGYLSSQWKCGLCSQYTCPDCNEVKGGHSAEHTCDPDMLASAQAIAKDSKNCPNCSAMIFRIAGCNHMFCTACHTGFDWKTGKLIRGSVGNPHYYEYISQRNGGNGNAAAAAQQQHICGDDTMTLIQNISRIGRIIGRPVQPLSNEIAARIEPIVKTERPMYDKYVNIPDLIAWMNSCMRNIAHTEDVLLVNTLSETGEFEAMETLRMRYLRNMIDDDQFRMSIQKQSQRSAMKREYRQIITMANQAAKDIISRMVAELRPACESINTYLSVDRSSRRLSSEKEYIDNVCDAYMRATTICDEMAGLCKYVKEQANDVVATYHSTASPYHMSCTADIFRLKSSTR